MCPTSSFQIWIKHKDCFLILLLAGMMVSAKLPFSKVCFSTSISFQASLLFSPPSWYEREKVWDSLRFPDDGNTLRTLPRTSQGNLESSPFF